jgi:nitrogen fixation protein FixH
LINLGKIGNQVTIDADDVSDGIYKTDKSNRKYIVKSSRITSIIHEVTYKTKNEIEIMVEQNDQYSYSKGENVWVNGVQAVDGEYKVIGGRNIIVEKGRIKKKKLF